MVVKWASRGVNGYILAVAAVAAALVGRLCLDFIGQFYYLPLVPAVMLPALLASRGATILAIGLCIACNVALVEREGFVDTVSNALLFAAVGLAIWEIAHARRAVEARSAALASELDRREATLHAMLASAPVVTLDAQLTVMSMSQPASELFRMSEEEAVGRSFQEFVEFFHVGLARTAKTSDPALEQYWLGRRSDGDVFPIGIQVAYVGADPASSQVVLNLTDLSLWHAAEIQNQELSEQLNQVWRMNSLGEMAAILSHELNQPLTAAASYLQATQTDLRRCPPVVDNASRTVDLAKGQILRAGEIIRRARYLLTVESRALRPERMSSMLEDLSPILQLLGPSSDAVMSIDVDGEDDRVMADRIQFQQAIVNLARNATEAVRGRDRREVRIVGRSVSETHYEVRVEDSGPGVPPEEVSRMFAPLTTTKSDGMGLGLSVTRTIVETHGGTLSVVTSDLGGAAFAFSLRRAQEEETP